MLDGDRRGKSFDHIDFRAFHLIEELTRVGRKRFDVAALAFRVDGVERERGFAGTRQTGNDGERVARNLDVDVLEIVLPRAPDDEFSQAHDPTALPPQELQRTVGTLRPE